MVNRDTDEISEYPVTDIETMTEWLPNPEPARLTEGSAELLKMIYEKMPVLPGNFDIFDETGLPRPPLIISFHAKISLLKNNVQEALLCDVIGRKWNRVPLWIPYVYDTGYKTAENKIRLPTYFYFEGRFIPIRASAKIRGNVICAEPPLKDKEIVRFFTETEKHWRAVFTSLKTMLNPYNFGHELFDLKCKLAGVGPKLMSELLSELAEDWKEVNGKAKTLAESLALISRYNLNRLNIDVGLVFIDRLLTELGRIVLPEILESSPVKKDPSLLENLFRYFDPSTKERAPILYTGDDMFIAYNDNDVKVFEGDTGTLLNAMGNHTVLPTGDWIMVLFTAIGCDYVLGGSHTVNYYPDYFAKAESLLKDTRFNRKLHLVCYGDVSFFDIRNISDHLAVIRVLDKVGSRNYIKKRKVELPRDIVDHLNFMGGANAVPREYADILESLQKFDKDSCALGKELKRNRQLAEVLEKDPEELVKNPGILVKWIRGTKFSGLHPVRLEVMLENLKADFDLRLSKIMETVKFERRILGGTITDENGNESVIYDGILIRSNRYPSLLEMVIYGAEPVEPFIIGGKWKKGDGNYIHAIFDTEKRESPENRVFRSYREIFDYLIPPELAVKIPGVDK